MKWIGKVVVMLAIVAVGAGLLVLPQFGAPLSASQDMSGMQHGSAPNPDEPVPAYHPQPPTDILPPTMAPAIFSEIAVANAYTVAGRVKKVLYQEPCYCHCDRSQGHSSLLDCFVSRHGSGCAVCMREAFYSYEQTRKGRTPAQIRDGIMHGEWQNVELTKYNKELLPASSGATK